MNLIVWNINRSSLKRFKRQMAAVAAYRPDILALTEVGIKAGPQARNVLGPLGYEHVLCCQDLLDEDERMTSSGVLFASRYPFEAMAHGELGVPIKHRALSAVFETPCGEVEGHVVHVVPGASYGWKKVEFFEAIYERLAREPDGPRFLCGDFNSPRLEESDGSVRVFGHRKDPRWAQAERRVITGLAAFGLGDAYRGVHGYEKFGWSHQLVRKGRLRWQRRFDYVFACPTLEAVGATYLHDLDEYSDHSPLEIRFLPGGVGRLIEGMSFEVDVRSKSPNESGRRLGRFKVGWRKAVRGESYAAHALRRLTWDNLGWRLGRTLGESSEAMMEAMYDRCVEKLVKTGDIPK